MRFSMQNGITFALAAAGGALAMYFLDPERGERRRHVTRDQVTARVRHSGRRVEKLGKYAGGHAYGAYQQVVHRVTPDIPPTDGEMLKHRVETVLFRDPSFPQGQLNINAVDGIVELRGWMETPQQIDDVEHKVRAIAGVKDVHNFLHLPNTPAPNKEAALEASDETLHVLHDKETNKGIY